MRQFFNMLLLTFISWTVFAKTPQHYTFAVIGPLSGPYAAYGQQLLNGATEAMHDINQRGGINGIPINLVHADDLCDETKATEIATQLAKDNSIHAIIGHSCSNTAMATKDIYANVNKLMLVPSATHTELTYNSPLTLFRLCGRNDRQAVTLASFMVEKLNSQRIAILYLQDIYAKELADFVVEEIAELQRVPSLYQSIPKGDFNIKNLIEKFKTLKIDSVFFAGFYPEVGKLAKAMYDANMQIPLIAGDGIALKEFTQVAGHASRAVLMSAEKDPRLYRDSQDVIATLMEKEKPYDSYTFYGYFAVETAASAIKAVESTRGDILGRWLHQNTVKTILGHRSFATNGDVNDANYVIYIWNQRGEYNEVQTAS